MPAGALPGDRAAALQAVIDAAVNDDGLPGVTATVLVADGGAWSGASGIADGVHPVDIHAKFAIASITKTFLAAEVMWLSEQGRLRLSDPVSEHLPSGFQFDTNGATIENLLSMESGIPDPLPDYMADLKHNWTAEEVLATTPAERSRPGDHYVYEDANYMLLGLVIEQTTGLSVAKALRAHILADPRLTLIVYQTAEQPKPPFALPFDGGSVRPDILDVGGGYLPSRSEASAPSGSGGMASDAGSLALWGYLLFGRDLLSEQSLRAMTHFGKEIVDDNYGMGVFDQTNLDAGFGTLAIGNGGRENGGYSSALTVLPSKGIVISVMTNEGGDPVKLVFPTVQKLAAIVER